MSKPKKKNNTQKNNTLFGLEPRTITLKTENQKEAAICWEQGNHLLMTGFAGTGKTFLALSFALHALERQHQTKIIIVRSAVQARDLGFLPGSLDEKTALYQTPYQDIVNDLCKRDDAYGILQGHHAIEFLTTSFLRGITIDNAVIIFDEIQNCTIGEIDSLITRVGENSRLILCGDDRQSDLHISGYNEGVRILASMKEVDHIEFGLDDIVRSGFAKSYLIAKYA